MFGFLLRLKHNFHINVFKTSNFSRQKHPSYLSIYQMKLLLHYLSFNKKKSHFPSYSNEYTKKKKLSDYFVSLCVWTKILVLLIIIFGITKTTATFSRSFWLQNRLKDWGCHFTFFFQFRNSFSDTIISV